MLLSNMLLTSLEYPLPWGDFRVFIVNLWAVGRRWFILASQRGSIAFQPRRSFHLVNLPEFLSKQKITGFTPGLR